MLKKIIGYIVIFFSGIASVLLLIAKGKRHSPTATKTGLDRDNISYGSGSVQLGNLAERETERIRAESERLKKERKNINRERLRAVSDESTIKNTRRTVSEIIRRSSKSSKEE
ncbi:MAG: hypothetical protein PF693_14490 [Spirochaetia bacterium]|nr:hypothetical protein [Spirochaetia bacterium]